MNNSFVEDLNGVGFFKHLSIEESRVLQEKIYEVGWRGIFENCNRFYPADAENLAEGGIGQFIKEVRPFLESEGVRFPEIVDDAHENDYVVRVDGVANSIYSEPELQRDISATEGGLTWGLSMTRGFAIVDRLLAAVGSNERVFAVNGGNDLFAFFLTPELCRVITTHPDASPEDGPYKPTEEYPWFGQPH